MSKVAPTFFKIGRLYYFKEQPEFLYCINGYTSYGARAIPYSLGFTGRPYATSLEPLILTQEMFQDMVELAPRLIEPRTDAGAFGSWLNGRSHWAIRQIPDGNA